MSGNDRRQGRGGGQQPSQGGQRRGDQQGGQRGGQQGGRGQRGNRQQGRGQRGQPPQGSPPPQGGGGGSGSSGGGVDTDGVKDILVWGIAAFTIAGLVLGLVPFLFGFAGNANDTTQSVSANSTLAQERAQEEAVANQIVSDSLSDDNSSAAAAYEQMRSQNNVVASVIALAPYLAILFAVVIALVTGVRSSADERTLAAGVAVATVVGLVLFVVLSTAIAGFQYNSMSQDDWRNQYNTDPADWGPYPASDFPDDAQQQYIDEYQNQYNGQPERGLTQAASVPSVDTIRGLSINYTTVGINALLFGIVSALGGGGIAVASNRFSTTIE
ncbi:hypothetical protein GRX03_09280 [Halovenus sp. WSH3]|uniref:Uncharacterized protein n=1 Tax=Halovenus carboxidivorans TaxID=2692199 RepID=A0A6B0T1G5_9EURY|nr:hypothetical protein [Halovenus carboxidivorans]MXR51795.1 hypothetical protein [Halovenus carboxidivorans]